MAIAIALHQREPNNIGCRPGHAETANQTIASTGQATTSSPPSTVKMADTGSPAKRSAKLVVWNPMTPAATEKTAKTKKAKAVVRTSRPSSGSVDGD